MGFKVTLKLTKSRAWKKIEKAIKSGELKIEESSSQLEKAVQRKLMTVDGLCTNCGTIDELYKDTNNQNPIMVHCGECYQRYAYVEVIPEDGAWLI